MNGPFALEEGLDSENIAGGRCLAANETPTSRGGTDQGRRKYWYIWGPILCGLVVLLAVSGGVLGSRRSSIPTPTAIEHYGNSYNSTGSLNSTNPSSNSTTKPTSSTDPLIRNNNTRLASVSWTDAASMRYDRLFYQDSDNNIRTSLFNPSHPVWHRSNVSPAVASDRTPLRRRLT